MDIGCRANSRRMLISYKIRAKKTIVRVIMSASEGKDNPKWMFLLLMMTEKGVVSAIRYMVQSAWKKSRYSPTTATVISWIAGISLTIA